MSAPQGDHNAGATEDEKAGLLDSLAMKTAEGRLNNRRVHNKVCGQSHLFLTFGAKPPISHVWGEATSFTRFLGFQFKPKEAVPLTRRLLPHDITLIRIAAIRH